MNRQAQHSYLGALYSLQLSQLGHDGFRTWLQESFNSVTPAPKAPYFYSEELEREIFGEVFARIAPELGEKDCDIARFGTLGALNQFPKDAGTYEGLYSLVRMAEGLGLFEMLIPVHGILAVKLLKDSKILHLPETDIEIYSLREALETLFRLAQANPSRLSQICEWAFNFMVQDMAAPNLDPVLAPAFVLARRHVSNLDCSTAKREIFEIQLANKLRKGYLKGDSPFASAYKFTKNGEHYPYDIEGIFVHINEWLRPIDAKPGKTLVGRFVRPLVFNKSQPSATEADRSIVSDRDLGNALLDVRAMELEGELA